MLFRYCSLKNIESDAVNVFKENLIDLYFMPSDYKYNESIPQFEYLEYSNPMMMLPYQLGNLI